MGKKSMLIKKLQRIEQIQRDIHKERKKVVIECAHQNENGKIKIEPVDDKGNYKCKFCKSVFNMNTIDRQELADAIELLHNTIQQIRCFSNSEKEEKIIKFLGELDYNLQETGELYDRIVNPYSKNYKNEKYNNKKSNNFGNYGSAGLSFINHKK